MKLSTMAQLLTQLAYAYPNTKLPTDAEGMKGVASVWVQALHGLDEQYVVQAVREWIQNEEWFPSPAGIRHGAISLQLGIKSEPEAWSAALFMVNSRDPKVYERTGTLVRGAVRDIGGPKALTEGVDTLKVREAFLRAYRARVQAEFVSAGRDNNSLAYSVAPQLGGEVGSEAR